MKTFDLSWGNAVAIRQAFLDGISNKTVFFALNDANLNYTPHDGNQELIDITRKVIERQVGPTYRHIFLVNGAAGGVTIAMRTYAQMGYNAAITREPPYFPIYPSMIRSSGLEHNNKLSLRTNSKLSVYLIDSPANPTGDIFEDALSTSIPIIHDAVYHSRVYGAKYLKAIPCNILVGSYSKLTGLNGIRTGWIATNNDLLALRIRELVAAEYCGLSSASDAVLLSVLQEYKEPAAWERFEKLARKKLNYNREEWSKIEKYFAGQPVNPIGMFYYGPMDKACQKLLNKSGITWTSGSSLGSTDEFGRINIGQDCKLIRDAVKNILKVDKI